MDAKMDSYKGMIFKKNIRQRMILLYFKNGNCQISIIVSILIHC